LIGAPVKALSSTSVTLAGSVVTGGGAAVRGGAAPRLFATPVAGGLERRSSLELQLEIPNAAKSDNTSTVKAMRDGVHNDFPLLVFFFACISYLINYSG
jgi:hypothetical protein